MLLPAMNYFQQEHDNISSNIPTTHNYISITSAVVEYLAYSNC